MDIIKKHKELIDVVKLGNPQILQKSLNHLNSEKKKEIIAYNNNEMLRWSLKYGNIVISDILLKYGATIEEDYYDELIQYICKFRDIEKFLYILNLKTPIIIKEIYLQKSIEFRNNDITKWILENYHKSLQFNITNLVPLAIENKNIDGLKIILSYGAKINKGNRNLLISVIKNQDEEMLEFLFLNRMNVTVDNSSILKIIMNQPNEYPKNLWIKNLVRKGADFNIIQQELNNKKYVELKNWCNRYKDFENLSKSLNNDLVENSNLSKPKL